MSPYPGLTSYVNLVPTPDKPVQTFLSSGDAPKQGSVGWLEMLSYYFTSSTSSVKTGLFVQFRKEPICTFTHLYIYGFKGKEA